MLSTIFSTSVASPSSSRTAIRRLQPLDSDSGNTDTNVRTLPIWPVRTYTDSDVQAPGPRTAVRRTSGTQSWLAKDLFNVMGHSSRIMPVDVTCFDKISASASAVNIAGSSCVMRLALIGKLAERGFSRINWTIEPLFWNRYVWWLREARTCVASAEGWETVRRQSVYGQPYARPEQFSNIMPGNDLCFLGQFYYYLKVLETNIRQGHQSGQATQNQQRQLRRHA